MKVAKDQVASNPSSLIVSPLSQDQHKKKVVVSCQVCDAPRPPPTRDVLAELVVVLLQRLHQLRDAALLDQRHLVVHVLVDEVAGGAGGEALHLLALAVEELHQLADALQAAHLQIGTNSTRMSEHLSSLLC